MTDAFTLDILRNYLLVGAALFSLGGWDSCPGAT